MRWGTNQLKEELIAMQAPLPAPCKPPCENPADGDDGLCSQCRPGVELMQEIMAAMLKFGEHRLSRSPGDRYDERHS